MIETREIAQGVHLHYLKTDKFKSQTLKISFTTKISKEYSTKMAIIPFILMQGSQKYPKASTLQTKLKSMYGSAIVPSVSKKGDFHTISLTSNCINKEYTEGTDLLLEIYEILLELIFEPLIKASAFDSKIVETEKNNLIQLINSQKNDKIVYANKRMIENMCKGENYSLCRFGDSDEALKITPENLYLYFIELLNTSKIDIMYLGNGEPKNLDFSKFTDREICNETVKSEYLNINVKEIIENDDITQGKLSIGLRTNVVSTDKDYPALALMNAILGGGTGSKLFRNVREKMSLCYYASSYVDKIYGVMNINSGIEIKDFDIAKKAILREFDDILKGEITQEEIANAKLTITNSLSSSKDEPGAILDYYFTNEITDSNRDIDELIKDIQKVSKDEVLEVCKKVKLDTIYFLKGDSNENV